MKIAAVAHAGLRMEIGSRTLPAGVEWIWADSVNAMCQCVEADLYFDLDFVMEPERIARLSTLLPKPIVINSVLHTLSEIDRPFARINAWPGFLERPLCELAVAGEQEQPGAGGQNDAGSIKQPGSGIGNLFEKLNWTYRIVPDIPGLISPRILAMIINEAYHVLQAGVSTKEEIDVAMKLGTNYPLGPFEWSRKIGLSAIYSLLAALERTDSRYQAAKALEEEVRGLKFD
jgi:3-hydroxybutyryl-CoA dehydrogenase